MNKRAPLVVADQCDSLARGLEQVGYSLGERLHGRIAVVANTEGNTTAVCFCTALFSANGVIAFVDDVEPKEVDFEEVQVTGLPILLYPDEVVLADFAVQPLHSDLAVRIEFSNCRLFGSSLPIAHGRGGLAAILVELVYRSRIPSAEQMLRDLERQKQHVREVDDIRTCAVKANRAPRSMTVLSAAV